MQSKLKLNTISRMDLVDKISLKKQYKYTYSSWQAMKTRCFNKQCPGYKHYGGRGITVCTRWLIFENFLKDMKPRPFGLSLGRLNNNGHYEPKNCKWQTPEEQMNNRRDNRFITINGKTQTVSQWTKELNLSYAEITKRYFKISKIEQESDKPVKGLTKSGVVSKAKINWNLDKQGSTEEIEYL